MVTAEWLPIS